MILMRIGVAAIAAGAMVAATTVAAPAGAGDDGIAVRVSGGDAFSSKYPTTVWVNKSVEGWPTRVTLRQSKTVEVMKPHQSVQLKPSQLAATWCVVSRPTAADHPCSWSSRMGE